MRPLLPLLALAAALGCSEAAPVPSERAQREARALAAVAALPDGDKRDAGLRIVRQAWRQFREDAAAAAGPVPADATPERAARLADLAARNRSLARLGRDRAAAEAHLASWPLDDEARARLGLIRLDAGDIDAALAELLTVLALDPAGGRELRGRIALARLAEAAPDDRASRLAEAAADLAPSIDRLLAAGAAAEAAADPAAAGTALAELERLAPAVVAPLAAAHLAALRACAAERSGDAAGALALWDRAVAGGAQRPDPAPRRRALIRRLEEGRIAPAIAAGDLAVLVRLSPSFPEHDALQDRCFRLLLQGGRLGEVLAAARELLAADPAHPLGLLLAAGAEAGLDSRRLELVPPLIPRVHTAAPELGRRWPVVHALDAALCELAGQPAAAAAALDPMLAAHPDDRDARWQRARLRSAAADHAGAAADCDALVAARPDDLDAIALRGRARAAAGDRAGALADADRVVAAKPGTATLLARARVRRALDDRAGALADIAAMPAAASAVTDIDPLLESAEMARELGDLPAQRTALEKAAVLGSADAAQRLRRLR